MEPLLVEERVAVTAVVEVPVVVLELASSGAVSVVDALVAEVAAAAG